ncbi:muscle M-line assembly protein unc-89 isoform X4 [Anopheles bellator]|uniref:muscle M-line assembly protein unc-89 isoform X4 n=1 Tax=Anopheles bellator TaxID=139047 RepID=UPI002647ADAB|nr:muscle M-line assembly protein unc-89 isoform X4 [Anopheles bellator]
MSEQAEQAGLPPGWDCKYDARTGRYYYVNLFTKTTQWEDPRARIRQLQTGAPLHISNDSIAMQPMHGSPYHVYPASNSFYPAQAAFQNPPSGVPSLTASPNFAQRLHQQQLQNHHIEMTPMVRSSPRMGLGRQGMLETTFTTNVTAAETDLTVAKINSMFPTVPETHIRMLLKKYMKSIFPKAEETLILDVLANADNNVQSASQQLLKMGYDKREQPVPQRSSSRKGTGTSQTADDERKEEPKTPTPKLRSPEEKKKIKARLQTKYKDTPEKIILMALESVDYSEDRAKKILNIVIQEDREKKKSVKIETPRKTLDEDKENARTAGSGAPSRSNSTTSSQPRTPLVKRAHDGPVGTVDDAVKTPAATTSTGAGSQESTIEGLIEQEADANGGEVLCADHTDQPDSTASAKSSPESPGGPRTSAAPLVASGGPKQSRPKAKTDHAKYSIFRSSSSEDESAELAQGSPMADSKTGPHQTARTAPKGPNTKLFKGPNDDLLLADYVTWNGANPDLAKGTQCKVGSGGMADRSVRAERTYKAHGPNGELCKGPVGSLAKGSMYAPMVNDVKCN